VTDYGDNALYRHIDDPSGLRDEWDVNTPSTGRIMTDEPERLPPPPFWRTQYLALVVMGKADRRWIDPAEIARAIAMPIRKERQADGRVRYWA
jgi:hypothetical protein